MKQLSLFIAFLVFAACTHAADLPTIASPDFKSPLPAEWKVVQGNWQPKDGVLHAAELPENKHVAVLWHQTAWQQGVIECEFQFDGCKSFIIGCDGRASKGLTHIGRATVTSKQISISQDSVKPSQILDKKAVDLKPGQWHKLRFEWDGKKITLQVNDARIEASHEYLKSEKVRSWLAVGNEQLLIRDLKIRGK